MHPLQDVCEQDLQSYCQRSNGARNSVEPIDDEKIEKQNAQFLPKIRRSNDKPRRKDRGITKAVIYCRVSSAKQTVRGDGLASQETRCREYAKYKGYEVVEIFRDDTLGSLTTRPGMQAMLAFLKANRRKEPHAVIIDDISRLARGLMAHFELRVKFGDAGGVLVSPSIEFGEDSDSQLVENLIASVSQHQRQKNGEQTVNRMRARVQNGYWVFQAPVGYRYECVGSHGKLLVRDEPNASILQEALEGYASGRFQSQVEVKRFLERQPAFPKDLPNGEICNQRITEFLTRAVYAGFVEVPNWNVSLRRGRHEGLISFETFEKIQAQLKSAARAPARKDINADFPLRGFILCEDCDKPLTACWSKSKTGKKHPYYLCPTKGCASYRKSIRRDDLEDALEGLLQRLQPTSELFTLAKAMFRDAWNMKLLQMKADAKSFEQQRAEIDNQTEILLARIIETDNATVVKAYEAKITKLERSKADRRADAENGLTTAYDRSIVRTLHALSLKSLGHLEKRRSHLEKDGAETGLLRAHRALPETGTSNPETAFPFKVLSGFPDA